MMRKDRVLLLIETNASNDIFSNDWKDNGYCFSSIFKKVSKPLRAIRRLWMKYNLPFSYLWLDKWFNELDNYDSIILHMSYLTNYLPLVISKRYPKLKIIGWYWNTIDNRTLPIDFHNSNIEYWTFDESDAKKYGLKKNIQYYVTPKNINSINKDIDIYFIGRDKGRKEKILSIKEEAKKQGLSCDFKIVENDNDILPYQEVKKYILRSKAILEINKDNQSGFTLRALESLFYQTKLITNNSGIVESDFYNKTNVFILDKDDIKELKLFVLSDYDHSVDVLKKNYDLDRWFNNFYEENS